MLREKIMIIDDEKAARETVGKFLQHKEYDVIPAENGKTAIELLKNMSPKDLPGLIVLDIRMPEMDGIEVCRHIKSDMKTKHIPILMFTVENSIESKVKGLDTGADDYLSKAADNAELLARIRALQRRFKKKPFEPSDESLLNIYCRPGSKIYIQCSGNINVVDMSKNLLDLDIEKYSRYSDNLPKDFKEWRFKAKNIGSELFDTIIDKHSNIHRIYYQAIGANFGSNDLHIRILSDREFLRVPIECLFGDDDYLCLKHPLVRTVERIIIRKQPVSPSFFNRLHSENESLRVLLVAANTFPSIPGVDEEFSKLQKSIEKAFMTKEINVNIKAIPSSDATYDNVRRELQNSSHHILHYCGHGSYDGAAAEKSGLHLWKDEMKNETKPLYANELQSLVEKSDLRFVYLSCCSGSATGGQQQLLDNDFLGIADALIHAGIPSVLGFRWPVADKGALKLAINFYDSLARDGRLDTALLEARRTIDRNDLTWLSPILIAQK